MVSDLELIKESKLGLDEVQTDEALSKIKNYIQKIKNEDLRNFVADLLSEYEEDFVCVPADNFKLLQTIFEEPLNA